MLIASASAGAYAAPEQAALRLSMAAALAGVRAVLEWAAFMSTT